MSGKCLYKSKQGSKCNYSVELQGSEATVKIGTTEISLTNGRTLSECAQFTYDQGTLLIEEDVCKCKKGILYLTHVDIIWLLHEIVFKGKGTQHKMCNYC